MARLLVGGAQQSRGVHRGERMGRQCRRHQPATIPVTRNDLPNRACAAVAPRATMIRGITAAISASSQGKQASISTAPGLP
jgi:hypothetical protein